MFKHINHQDASDLMKQGHVILLDVRDYDSYVKRHIRGAHHLSPAVLAEFITATDPSTPVIVYCYHGISSQSVALHLLDNGFTTVYNLTGGFDVWQQHHHELTTSGFDDEAQ